LAIPRAFLPLFWTVLQATEDQKYLVRWTLLSALINLSLDWLLIPRFGAIGAAAANGVTQLFATIGIVARARGLLRLELPLRFLGRVTLCSLVMSAAVILLAAGRSPGQAVFIGVISGVLIFLFMLRITGCLESQDRRRLWHLHAQMPKCLQSAFCWGLWALVPVADRKS
jgi:O-antigen/teichoic acid export membrane protein